MALRFQRQIELWRQQHRATLSENGYNIIFLKGIVLITALIKSLFTFSSIYFSSGLFCIQSKSTKIGSKSKKED